MHDSMAAGGGRGVVTREHLPVLRTVRFLISTWPGCTWTTCPSTLSATASPASCLAFIASASPVHAQARQWHLVKGHVRKSAAQE